ncbi:hypothetical protein LCM28_05630 [Salipiger pacificus]|nr:hypothetical protein [Alloyangia pacifica]
MITAAMLEAAMPKDHSDAPEYSFRLPQRMRSPLSDVQQAHRCRHLFAAASVAMVEDAVVGPPVSGADPISTLVAIAAARRSLLEFARSPNQRRHNFGFLVDMSGLDREAAGRGIQRLAAAGWPREWRGQSLQVRPSPFGAYVSNDGTGYFCPPPHPKATNLKWFLYYHPQPTTELHYW